MNEGCPSALHSRAVRENYFTHYTLMSFEAPEETKAIAENHVAQDIPMSSEIHCANDANIFRI